MEQQHKTDEVRGGYITQEEVGDAMAMLGQGYEGVRVKDESNDRKYFVITPRIVKAYSRNPFDLALWDTIKDIAGESGECYLNTEQLAVLSGMSTGQVSKSRRYWLKLGFLKGEQKRDKGYTQKVWHLTVPDLWKQNIEWCEKHPKITDRLTFRKAHRSLHQVKASHGEGKGSPGETKKIEVKKNHSEKEREEELMIFKALSELTGGGLNSETPKMVDTWTEKHSPYWIIRAVEIAKSKGARSARYVDSILVGWEAKGYPKTRDERVAEKRNEGARSTEDRSKYLNSEYSEFVEC